jgi:hypothetical protein
MPRKKKRYHFIYKTTNLLSGKYYIGMHSTDNLEDGYMGSGKRLRYSLNKYGKENHKVEILEFFGSREELAEREKEIVNLNEIAKEDCINLKVGGEGGLGFVSLSACTKGGLIAGNIIKKRIESDSEFREKTLATLHNNMKNIWKTPEIAKKILTNLELGRGKHSEEYKKKLSSIKKGTGMGQSNSQYGTCWITNGKENKKIKKNETENHINCGWRLGRI